MSKTHKPLAMFKQNRRMQEEADRLLRRAARIGTDPRNTVNTAAALYGRILPETEVVNGRRVWKV